MAVSESQKMAQIRYNAKTYDQVLVRVKKGKRDEYKKEAELRGLALMEFFRQAAEEYIANHKVE